MCWQQICCTTWKKVTQTLSTELFVVIEAAVLPLFLSEFHLKVDILCRHLF